MKTLPFAIGLSVLCALFALTWLARPIQDPDFFWHLKMGEWLWQHHSWPIPDPFAFTTPSDLDHRQFFIIKGYWLSQLLYFGCHGIFGWTGVYLLRLSIFASFVWVMWKNQQRDLWLWVGLSLICLVAIFDLYPVERPQFFSFLLFAWMYWRLDRLWSGLENLSRWHFWVVGIVMLVWGNLHGGVILGQVLLLITLGLNVCLYIRNRQSGGVGNLDFSRLAVIGFLLGCLNPNIFRVVPIFFQMTDTSVLMFAVNDEYASILKAWHGSLRPLVVIYLVFVSLSVIALAYCFRRQTHFSLLVLAGTAVYAAMHVRYIPFFLLAALPVIVRGLAEITLLKWVRGLIIAGMIVFTTGFVSDERGGFPRIRSAGWVSDYDFPVGVSEQVLNSGINGRLFNTYRWGGYLLWRLGPERQIFVDGRQLDDRVIRDALTAEMVSFGGGRLIWKEIFDKYRIDYAILPLVEQGQPYALTNAIARDPMWQMVFTSGNAALLIRR